MNDIPTYALMTELCKRLSDHLYDPEPVYDAMLSDMGTDYFPLGDLHGKLKRTIEQHKDIVEKRIQDTGEFS